MVKKRGGRPSKLTPEVKKKLLDAIRAGSYYEPACRYAGIDYSTFRKWMKKGEEQGGGQFFQFFEEVKEAEAQGEMRVIGAWQNHIPQDWRAAMEFLARRYPDRWKKRETQEHTGEGGGPIELEFDPREELLRRIDRMSARGEEEESDPES